MLSVGAGNLAAQPRRRHHLAWVGEAVRVKRAPQAVKALEILIGEHRGHVHLLVDADAVLARDRAAGLHARPDDQTRELLGTLGLSRARGVVTDERMEVA